MRHRGVFVLAIFLVSCGSPDQITEETERRPFSTTCPVGYGGVDCSELLPLPVASDGSWSWAETDGAICRDGSAAGVSVRYTGSSKLLIYLEGGGACFNGITCSNNASFVQSQVPSPEGIFDLSNRKNPVPTWNMVYIPYCTGDLHAGAKPDGLGGAFVGGNNYRLFLERIVKTFGASIDRVLLVGYSAGGMGATINYDVTATAFGAGVAVDLVADAATVPQDPFMEWDNSGTPTAERQSLWRSVWNLDAMLPSDCSGCFNADGGGLSNLYDYLATKYPTSQFGLISSTQDETLRFFYGVFGRFSVTFMPACTFQSGVESLLAQLQPHPNWGTYIYPSAKHGKLPLTDFYKDKNLKAWFAAMVDSRSTSQVDNFKRCR